MTSMDMSQYLGAFLDEAGDNLKHLDDLILAVEKDPSDMDNLAEIFRSAHTLKGMSATMGFDRMASLTHAMEDMLDYVRKGTYALKPADMDLLFRSLDTLQSMVDSIRSAGGEGEAETGALVQALRDAVKPGKPAAEVSPAAAEPGPDLTDQEKQWVEEAAGLGLNVYEIKTALSPECLLKAARAYMVVSRLDELGDIIKTEPSVEALENEEFDLDFLVFLAAAQPMEEIRQAVLKVSEVQSAEIKQVMDTGVSGGEEETEVEAVPEKDDSAEKTTQSPPPAAAAPAAQPLRRLETAKKASQTVRVDIDRLDKLMNLVGELVIGRARIERLVQEAQLRDFDEPLSQLGRISGDIQELVTKLRMVPVSFIFERFPRLVRDLSKTLGKEIELQMEGQETELDRTVIDEIGDPMVHIIRNCLDHGIETIENRRKAGKPEKGLIRISAYQEGSGVIIEVTDDGKGINAGKVRSKALANGVITEEESAAMSDEEVVNLIFLPGFSMAEKVTDVSGRGVGMDAVKTKVESLGGQFDVSTEVGVGTRVFVRLPLTLAIVLALLIKVGEETYAIPLENVEETILVKKENVRTVHGTPATLLRGEVLTLCSLAGSLGASAIREEESGEFPVVVVKTGRMRVGFIVDDLIGQQDIVIKSLGRFLSKIRGIAGATILGDGNVALILDVAGLYGR